MRKTLTILTLIASLAAGLVTAAPADAGFYNRGVKTVDFQIAQDACVQGLFACTPNAGDGMSNRLYVTQADNGDGLEFGDVDTTSTFGDSHVWFAATLGAECRTGYHLSSAWIVPGWQYTHGTDNVPIEVTGWSMQISVPSAKTMPSKLVAINVPTEHVLGPWGSLLHEFDSPAEIFAYGESVIAQRVASGMSEPQARSQGFVYQANVALSAKVWCEGNVSGNGFYKTMPRYLPLTIEFVGVPVPGVQDQAVGDSVAVAPRVTDVQLTVDPLPDECVISVSGWFQADADLTAHYRLIDQYGQRSNAFSVDIQAGATSVRSHHLPIPHAPTGPGGNDGPSLVTPTGPGSIGGLTDHASDNYRGHVQIEVYSPNLAYSTIVGFNVDHCPTPEPVTPAPTYPPFPAPPTTEPPRPSGLLTTG